MFSRHGLTLTGARCLPGGFKGYVFVGRDRLTRVLDRARVLELSEVR